MGRGGERRGEERRGEERRGERRAKRTLPSLPFPLPFLPTLQRDIATVLSKSGNKIMLDSNSLLLDGSFPFLSFPLCSLSLSHFKKLICFFFGFIPSESQLPRARNLRRLGTRTSDEESNFSRFSFSSVRREGAAGREGGKRRRRSSFLLFFLHIIIIHTFSPVITPHHPGP